MFKSIKKVPLWGAVFLFILCVNLYSQEIIKGRILEVKPDYITIFDINSFEEKKISGKFQNYKKGEFIKIFIDNSGKVIKIKEIKLKKVRERIKKIRKFKCRCRCWHNRKIK